jgi:ATP-dependent Clp protease ATP-binding subunit ClpB
MRLDRLTTKTREGFAAAQQLANELGNPELYPEHLALALLVQEGGVAAPIVQKAGADPKALIGVTSGLIVRVGKRKIARVVLEP